MNAKMLRPVLWAILFAVTIVMRAHGEPWRFAVLTDTHMPTGRTILTDVRDALFAESPDFVLVAGI